MPEPAQLELFDAAEAPVASPDPRIARNATRPASRAVPGTSEGPSGHVRARRRRPGARRRGYSGPVPGHRRAHLPSRRLPPLSASGRRSLRPLRGRIRQTPAAPAFAESRPLSADNTTALAAVQPAVRSHALRR